MKTIGLDVGGANLKAAHSSGAVISQPFALWREPARLAEQLQRVLAQVPEVDRLAVTMTAELCDCFATKRQGVIHVLDAVRRVALQREVCVWSTQGRFLTPAQACEAPLLVAASNWHALATLTAQWYPQGLSLLVDIGSTTTDLIPLEQGRLAVRGRTDLDRLTTGELLYAGSLRTPVMTLGPSVKWRGESVGLMAEYFATVGDVYRVLRLLPEDETDTDTADGRPATIPCSAARLARMIGADMDMLDADAVHELARELAGIQQQRLVERAAQAMQGRTPDRLILSGSGAFIAESLYPEAPRIRLAQRLGDAGSSAACAVAMVTLRDQVNP